MTGRITAADIDTAFPYSSADLTEAINEINRTYGKINAMGIFNREGISSTLLKIVINHGEIVVLPATERGGPATDDQDDDSKTFYVECAHIPHKGVVGPDDIQNYLDIMGKSETKRTVEGEVAKKLKRHRTKHDQTLEYMEMSVIKGVWRDGANKVLMDWFEFFNVEKKQIFFDLDNDDVDLVAKTDELSNHIYDNCTDDTLEGVVTLVDRTFFNKFVQHPKFEKYFDKTDAFNKLANMPYSTQGGARGRRVVFQGVYFEEYNGQVTRWDKTNGVRNVEKFIATGMGHAIPLGTKNTFETHFGAAYSVSEANSEGDAIYITRHDLPHEEGIELKSQSNPLVICKRPQLLVECSAAAS